MEQTQQLDWDESALVSDSTEGSQEPVGKLRLCSGEHGPERDFWIYVGDNIIGRLESCEVTLPAQSVSKKHAVIEAEADCHTIYDCGSLNKTRRRKTVLKPHVRYALADGDLLLFADVACQYFILSQTDREEGVLPSTTAAKQHDGIAPLNACLETESVETTQDFNSDDESVLVPATQTNAVKSLVFVKTPAARKMGYGGLLAKDSDEEDGGENTLPPPGRSKGSEDSTLSREGGDLCTSATLNTPNGATVIPESDDECPETSVVSAPSMHLQYDTDTEAEESLIKPDSAATLHPGASAPTLTAGKNLKVVDEGGKAKVSVVGSNLDTRSVAEAQCGGVTEQKPALYHLDSDTDVEGEDEEVITKNGAQKHKPALFHVDSDTDDEKEQNPSTTSGGDFVENRELVNGEAAGPDLKAAKFHLDSDTDVEEDVDALAKVKPGLPDIDFGSDTDVEENMNAPLGIGVNDGRRDNGDDVENKVAFSEKALNRRSSVGAAQDSDTDVDKEPKSGVSAKAQECGLKPGDTEDSDTDVEDDVAECSGSARKDRDPSEVVPVQEEDDEDTDIEDANEKPCSDTEADDSPYMAMEATQCYVTAVPNDGVEAKDGNFSSESNDEEEATQAFVFKSPPIQLVPFKKPHVPSPGARALSLPVCTSSEKEEYSDDENFAVADTQSFCRGPDLSDICVEEEPTQPFFLEGGIGLECPPISTLKDIGSTTEQRNARMPGRNSSREDIETENLAEEETQLFCAHSTPVTPGAKQCQNPSQDETQPIELYLGLQVGRVESSEAFVDHQSVMDQKTVSEFSSSSDSEVKHCAAVKNIRPSFLCTVKTGASHSSSTSLLESQESEKQSVEAAHSEESTQPLSLRLSEEPTQSYTIDLSEEPKESEAFDTQPVLPLLDVQEGSAHGPAVDQDGASTQALKSPTTDSRASGQLMQDSGIPTTPAISPGIDNASEPLPGPSDMVKSVAPKAVSGAELFVKKEPALNKRGRKKKPVVEVELAVPPSEPVNVLVLPAQEATTHLPDTELEVKDKLPQISGRPMRRTAANSSSLGKTRKDDVAMTEGHEKPNAEETKEMEDVKEGWKVKPGKGTRRNVTPQELHCVTVAETDMMEGPCTIPSSTSIDATAVPQSLDHDVEAAAPKEQCATDVDARITTNLSTPSVAASTTKGPHIVYLDRVSSTHTFIKDMEVKVSRSVIDDIEKATTKVPADNVESILTDAMAATGPSTFRSDGTQIDTTIAQRRNGKRGQDPVKATLTAVESERSRFRNRKVLATPDDEVEIMEGPKVESAPTRGRGRSKKAASINIREQLEPVATPVELATLTRTSRTMKLSTAAGTEEALRLAASMSGRIKRVVPVQNEDVDEKKDHPLASEGRKPTKKPLTVELNEAAEVKLSPAMCREEEVIAGPADEQPQKKANSNLSTSRHVKETSNLEQLSSGGEPVLSDQSDASSCKHVLKVNLAPATMAEQAITNDPTMEQAVLSRLKESSSTASKHAPSKPGTVDKSEDMTSLAVDTLATGKRDTMEAYKEMTGTPSNKRGNRKRGTRQTKNVEAPIETATSVAVPSAFIKNEIVKTSEEVTEKAETPVSAPCASKKRVTVEAEERKAAQKTLIPTPRASRSRKNIDTDIEVTEEPAMAARASRKRGIVKTDGESVEEALLAHAPRKRGAVDVDKMVIQETNNLDLRAGSELKKQTCAVDEESKRKRGLGDTAETEECLGRKQAEKEGVDESNAERTRNAELEQQHAVDLANEDAATVETVTPPNKVGRLSRRQALKTETNFSKVEKGGCSKSKRRRAVTDEDTMATESAATTCNSHSEDNLEMAVGGRRKKPAVADKSGKATINQLGTTEQDSGQNSSVSHEGPTYSITTRGVEDRQRGRSQENVVPKEGKTMEEGILLETLDAEGQKNSVQLEGLQVRGRGSQRRKPKKVEETSMAEEQQATAKKTTEDIQEKAHSRSASRSHSNGRSKAESSQESLPPGKICRKQSSASSDGKAEDINIPQEAETPRRKGRGPNVSSSPGFFGDHGCPKVMFTGVIDEKGEQVVQRLGGELADSVYECTHLVTDRIRRTVKFLCAVSRGIPIVTLDWLEKCGKNKCFLSPSSFLVKDREQELNFNFRLSESLQKARKQRLLEGYEIHVTPSVKPAPEDMKDIIQCSGATFLSKMPREYKDKRVIISCSADLAKSKHALNASLPIANAEFILTGILQQLADLDAFRLEGTATAEGQQPLGGKRASTSSNTLPPPPGASKRRR